MKECVACAEEIKVNAKLCRHCGTLQNDERFGEHEGNVDSVQAHHVEAKPAQIGFDSVGGMTPFDTRCEILADVWLNYRDQESLLPLFEYFDVGFPLACAHHQGNMVHLEPSGRVMINLTWKALLEAFGHEEDTGFTDLEKIANSN